MLKRPSWHSLKITETRNLLIMNSTTMLMQSSMVVDVLVLTWPFSATISQCGCVDVLAIYNCHHFCYLRNLLYSMIGIFFNIYHDVNWPSNPTSCTSTVPTLLLRCQSVRFTSLQPTEQSLPPSQWGMLNPRASPAPAPFSPDAFASAPPFPH